MKDFLRWFIKHPATVNPVELTRQADEIKTKLEREEPKLTALAAYLNTRRLQNGFGSDFEYTLRPKGVS